MNEMVKVTADPVREEDRRENFMDRGWKNRYLFNS